jgi:hypothetical protein
MTRIRQTLQMAAEFERVFSLIRDPQTWKDWHPSSLAVLDWPSGAVLDSLGVKVVERFRVAGFSGQATWRVTAYDPHRILEMRGSNGDGSEGYVRWTLLPHGTGTLVHRELYYAQRRPLVRFLDTLLFRHWVKRNERRAMRNLKRLVESGS